MNITREQLEQLARIYNTLMNISTKGEDTFIMADCLRAMEKVVTDIDKANSENGTSGNANSSNSPAFTPEVVEE